MVGVSPGYCPACNRISLFRSWDRNFRESGLCVYCGCKNRQRQIALVASAIYSGDSRYRSFADNDLAIYNLEANGGMHRLLRNNNNYHCSEYLGSAIQAGTVVNGVRHEDVHSLSFADESFDLVVSSDVWEHLHSPYVAHEEIFRVLKKGGRHIFTVPFYQASILDEQRAVLDGAGEVQHLLSPIYHLDPLSSEGVLVYNIFSIETLVRLARLGFRTSMYKLYSPIHGVLGNNGLVFDAWKPW